MSIYTNPFLEQKKRNIELLLRMIKDFPSIEYPRLISMYQFNTGVSEKTAKGHLRILVNLGTVVIEQGYVKIVE